MVQKKYNYTKKLEIKNTEDLKGFLNLKDLKDFNLKDLKDVSLQFYAGGTILDKTFGTEKKFQQNLSGQEMCYVYFCVFLTAIVKV